MLRVVAGTDAGDAPEVVLAAEAGAAAPPVAVVGRPAAEEALPRRRVLPIVLALSLVAHAAAIGILEYQNLLGEERSAGGSADPVVIEGIAVELIASVPVPPTLPSVAATDALETAETVDDEVAAVSKTEAAEANTVAVRPDRVARAEPMEPDAPPVEVQAAGTPPPDTARPVEDTVRPDVVEDDVIAPVEEVAPPPAEKRKPPKAKPGKAMPAKSAPAPAPAAAATAKAKGAGAGKVGSGGTSDGQGKASATSYRAKVATHLQRRRFYPNEAKRGRLGGTAVVRFTLNARGGVVSATIARSAGHAILDRAAIAMVKRASPFPPIPEGLGASITVEAPIRFEPPR